MHESDLVVFDGTCSSDPDGVIVAYEWDLDLAMDSDGDGDAANDVDATGPTTSFTWFDDYESEVRLTVTDDDGNTDAAIQTVTVLNVDPDGTFGGAFVEFNLTLRMAGEKWHNVNLDVHVNYNRTTGESDGVVASLEVERWPGSPSANPTAGDAVIPIRVDLTSTDVLTAVIAYDPFADDGDAIRGDQPINGQVWGDNPVWLISEFADGTTCKLKHNFNGNNFQFHQHKQFYYYKFHFIFDYDVVRVNDLPGLRLKFLWHGVSPVAVDATSCAAV